MLVLLTTRLLISEQHCISIRCFKKVSTRESNKPLIVVADSQFLVVSSLVNLIESDNKYKICGIAENRLHLLNLLSSCLPNLLVTDFNLFDYDGIDDLITILHDHNQLAVLILVNQTNANEVIRLARSGIKNIALKTDDRQDLLTSIEMAVRKKKHFSDPILDMILVQNETRRTPGSSSVLTHSEIEIVRLIANGLTTKEIAEKKHISVHTVMTHRKNIFRKLEVNSISELTKFAIQNGLTDFLEYNI